MTNHSRIAVVGGGPGGLMLARLLQMRGLQAIVLERDAHPDDRPQGGSLDLHGETGQRAMQLAGLEDAFLAEARPEDQGDRLYDASGALLFDRDGLGDNRPEIDRTALRHILLRSLEPDTMRWGRKVETVTPTGGRFEIVGAGEDALFDTVVGADGGWSRVRPLLSDAQPAYEGVTLVELGFDAKRDPLVDALVGGGKMFAVGDDRVLIAQRNGHGHIRGYAGWRLDEGAARRLKSIPTQAIRAMLAEIFAGWGEPLRPLIEGGDILAVRPLYALPVGHRWTSRPSLTLLGDAAHLMSPFSGEGVNLALADAIELADALASGEGPAAVARYEAGMIARASRAAADAAQALRSTIAPGALSHVLEHYRARVAA